MAFVPAVDEVWESRFVCLLSDQVSVNRRFWHITQNDALPVLTDEDLANAIDLDFQAQIKDVMSSLALYRGVSVQRRAPLPRTVPAIVTASAGTGNLAGDALPTQVCGLVALKTDLAGKEFQGRFYTPFPSEAASQTNGHPTAAFLSSLDNLGDQLISTVSIAGTTSGSLVAEPCFILPTGLFRRRITSYISRDRWATQRRRGGYGSQNVPPF